MTELVLATRNQDKLREMKILLKGLPLRIFSLSSFKGIPDVKENGRTLEANAKKKALYTSRALKKLCVADDSGLEVKVLDAKPGVYSARFSGKGATYKSNNEKLLSLLRNIPPSKRKAQFRCVIAIADKGRLIGIVEGKCKGRITCKSIGKSGFGYDPIFMPDGYKRTFAQIGLRKKNRISHRKKALVQAKKILKRYVLMLRQPSSGRQG